MKRKRLLVINPNSNAAVTSGIDASLDPLRQSLRADLVCETTSAGPFGIESDDDVAVAAGLMVRRVGSADADGFVIACYSDPGVARCREVTTRPVLGIQEGAARYCAERQLRFGVLALSSASIARHVAHIQHLGLEQFHAGERELGISVEQSASDPATRDKVMSAAQSLIQEAGAQAIVLGCAGMVRHRKPAEAALGVPVIDPVQAAVELAHGMVTRAD